MSVCLIITAKIRVEMVCEHSVNFAGSSHDSARKVGVSEVTRGVNPFCVRFW